MRRSVGADEVDRGEVRLPTVDQLVILVRIAIEPRRYVERREAFSHDVGRGFSATVESEFHLSRRQTRRASMLFGWYSRTDSATDAACSVLFPMNREHALTVGYHGLLTPVSRMAVSRRPTASSHSPR